MKLGKEDSETMKALSFGGHKYKGQKVGGEMANILTIAI